MALFISQGLWANLPHLIRFLILNKQKNLVNWFRSIGFFLLDISGIVQYILCYARYVSQ